MSFELLHLHWDFRGLGFNSEMYFLNQPHGYNGMNIQEYLAGLWVVLVNILFFKAIRANTFRLRKMAIAVLTIAIPVCISLAIMLIINLKSTKLLRLLLHNLISILMKKSLSQVIRTSQSTLYANQTRAHANN